MILGDRILRTATMLGRGLTPLWDHSNWFLVCFYFGRSAFLHDLSSASITQVLSITGMNTVWLIIRKNHLRFSRSMKRKSRLWRRGWHVGRLRIRNRNKLLKRKFKILVEFGRKVVCVVHEPWTCWYRDVEMCLFYTHSALFREWWYQMSILRVMDNFPPSWIWSSVVIGIFSLVSLRNELSLVLISLSDRLSWCIINSDLPANAEVLCSDVMVLWTVH